MGKLIDMVGKRFGSLVVIKRDPQPHVKPYWICKCDCGREISVYGTNLRNGKTTQCKFCGSTQGAYKRYKELYDSLPGKKFNYITVLKEDSSKPSGEGLPKQWLCKCDCGKIMSLSTHNILSEKMMSCGCIKNSKGEELLSKIFSTNNIIFETQKTFETCRFPITKALAKFDFYLPEDNILIEFDGKQHSIVSGGYFTDDVVNAIKERDAFKNNWCIENNIKLIRFNYLEIEKMNWDYVKEKIYG